MKNIITKREKQIFQLLIDNKSTKEISNILNISEKTVRNHISNVMQKLDVINRTNAIIELIKLNEINIKKSYYICLMEIFMLLCRKINYLGKKAGRLRNI